MSTFLIGLLGVVVATNQPAALSNFVEKTTECGEVANRPLTLAYGADGTQTVNDTVANWRNVAPCGN